KPPPSRRNRDAAILDSAPRRGRMAASASPTRRLSGHFRMAATAAAKRRAVEIARRLQQSYPDAECALEFRTPLELLIAVILSAQCTDVRVNIVTRDLFRRYRSARDYADAPLAE